MSDESLFLGMMGYSYSNDDGPQMCFNAPKNAQLGWYDDKVETISASGGSFNGDLYGISDYGTMPGTASVIVKITGSTDDWYVSYNKRSGINSGTVEGGNQVLIHRRSPGSGYAVSTLVAKLTAGQTYNANGIPLPVTVNNISNFAQVTIGTVTSTAPTTNVSTFDNILKDYHFLLAYHVLTTNFPSSSTSQQAPQLLPRQSLQLYLR